jgi:uncharacterized protein (DUF927 family)
MPLDEIGQADGKEIANIVYMQANAIGKMRMNRDTTARDSLTWLTLVLSSGELPIEAKLTEDRKRAHAGHLVRLLDVKADRANGAFDEMAEGVGVIPFVSDCARAASTSYGTAGREFVRRLLIKGVTSEDVRKLVDEFVRTELFIAKSGAGQSARAAQRLGLIAAAGELAIELGVLPWSKGEATEAARWALRQWLEARGTVSSIEERQAIARVRRYIEAYGESRFDPLSGGADSNRDDDVTFDVDAKRSLVRAGFRKGQDEHRRWLVFPEMWRTDVCQGLDPVFAAATLAKHGMLERDKDRRNLAKVVKIKNFAGGKAKRFYVLTPRLFEDE